MSVLLATRNGAQYLRQQLGSIAAQSHTNWLLYISDDASSDDTLLIVADFAAAYPGRIALRQGPNRGCVANFLTLVADPKIRSDYFAYCDQDDIWHPDRLRRALHFLETGGPERPLLYGSRTAVMDQDGFWRGYSHPIRCQLGFTHALVQNFAGGNTMVFNRAAKLLLEEAALLHVAAHDWWTYQLVSAAGGEVHYDFWPGVRYRQHAANLIGSNVGWSAGLKRLKLLAAGRFQKWSDINVAALESCERLITPQNRKVLYAFTAARADHFFWRRLRELRRSGVYRNGVLGNFGLVGAGLLKKL